jgi:hypothetical protein
MASLQDQLRIIEHEAKASEAGDNAAHVRCREAAWQLLLSIETPAETTMRMRFSVRSKLDIEFQRRWTDKSKFHQQFAIRTFIEDGVLDQLCVLGHDTKGVSADELAEHTGEDTLLIGKYNRTAGKLTELTSKQSPSYAPIDLGRSSRRGR